jgi:hypothetical protein
MGFLAAGVLAVRCGGDDGAASGTTAAQTTSTTTSSGPAGQGGQGGSAGSSVATGGSGGATGTSTTGGGGGVTPPDAAGGSSGGGGATTGGGLGGATSGGGAGGGQDGGGTGGGGRDSGADTGLNGGDAGPGAIQYVFVVLEENHNWSAIKALPYIAHLLQVGSHSEQYYNPRGLHPSEPNYIWLEAGSNYGLTSDNDPSSSNLVRGAAHLSKLLDAKGISWTSYQEDIAAGTCPIRSSGNYAAKHDPFIFFDDVVGNPPSANNQHCIDHHKPFSQFLPDLKNGAVARYNFITPNLQNDMHDGTPAQGDTWLKNNIDPIFNPASPNHNAAIYAKAALLITWDEGEPGDGPIGFIVISPFAKVGFTDTTTPSSYFYTHSSTLLSLQKIFGVASPPLADAATARDLSNLFITFP